MSDQRHVPVLEVTAVAVLVIFAAKQLPLAHAASGKTDLPVLPAIGGVRLGTPLTTLKSKHPNLYRHRLVGGEVLYEACNQNTLHAFSFTEQPWAPGEIGEVAVRDAPVGVCRDETGRLPDLKLPPATERNVKLGDTEEAVLKVYGKPDQRDTLQSGQTRLRYRIPAKMSALLVFMLAGDKVTSISAGYTPPESWRSPQR